MKALKYLKLRGLLRTAGLLLIDGRSFAEPASDVAVKRAESIVLRIEQDLNASPAASDGSISCDEPARISGLERRLKQLELTLKALKPVGLKRAPAIILAFVFLFCLAGSCAVNAIRVSSPDGFLVTYYAKETLEKKICVRSEDRLFKDYGRNGPALFVPKNHFSARWCGVLFVPQSAKYDFYAQCDDGVRLFVDGNIIIDHWNAGSWNDGRHGSAFLDKGKHDIVAEFRENVGSAALRIRWCGGGVAPNTVIGVPYVTKPTGK